MPSKPTKKTSRKRAVTRPNVQQKFAAMRADMKAGLIERDGEIDLVLTAMLAGEHVNLVGPPGTAKSLLLDTVMEWVFDSSTKFSCLMSKHTNPEEVFGPVSISALKQDQYRRNIENRLPTASFAFLDEIYKASSAVLNTMLRILNEREFDNGSGGMVECPLRLCVAASNEWPGGPGAGGEELGALFDRFLFRKNVVAVTRTGRERLLRDKNLKPQLSTSITSKEIDKACAQVANVDIPKSCLLYTSPSPRDGLLSRMPSSA